MTRLTAGTHASYGGRTQSPSGRAGGGAPNSPLPTVTRHHPPHGGSWDGCVPENHSRLPPNSQVTFQKLISSAGAWMQQQ